MRISEQARGLLYTRLAKTIHKCRREAFETETRRSFSHVGLR